MRDIRLALIICTYHRPKPLLENIEKLRGSRFFTEGDELYHRLHIYVVDNGRDLKLGSDNGLTYISNRNSGGSGGFRRGMEEVRKDRGSHGFTNIILMDDDVEFIMESFYRLYALLGLMSDEHVNDVIAGRMFRTDDRKIQYTAAEIWNGGNLKHIGFNTDMTQAECLDGLNDQALETGEKAEYTGWWMACFPAGYVMENDPLHFFLHCDDAEYGIRHGGVPVILNGIQVWHETYEYRQSHVIDYFDRRNSLLLNRRLGNISSWKEYLPEWMSEISRSHVDGNYVDEYVRIRAFGDAIEASKDDAWLRKRESEEYYKKLTGSLKRNEWMIRIINKVYWRIVRIKAQYNT